MSYELPLKLDDARTLLKEVVGEKPGFVYASWDDEPGVAFGECKYVHDDEPGCLVGQVLFRAGIPLADLLPVEGVGVSLGHEFRSWLTADAARYLASAQRVQDVREPWSEALASAEGGLALTKQDHPDQ